MFIFKVPRSVGEPGIFLIFVYFLLQLQRLRPLGYCAPLTAFIIAFVQLQLLLIRKPWNLLNDKMHLTKIELKLAS